MAQVKYTEEHWQFVEEWLKSHPGKQQDNVPMLEKDFEINFGIKASGLSLINGTRKRKRARGDVEYILLVGTGRIVMCPNIDTLNRKIRLINGEKYTVYKKATVKIVEVV